MSSVDCMAVLVREIARPGAQPGEGSARAIARAARRLGLSHRQASRLWHRERKVIPSELMDRARRIADEPVVREAKNELAEFDARIARLETLLGLEDEDFHQPTLDALREMAGRAHRAVDRD